MFSLTSIIYSVTYLWRLTPSIRLIPIRPFNRITGCRLSLVSYICIVGQIVGVLLIATFYALYGRKTLWPKWYLGFFYICFFLGLCAPQFLNFKKKLRYHKKNISSHIFCFFFLRFSAKKWVQTVKMTKNFGRWKKKIGHRSKS